MSDRNDKNNPGCNFIPQINYSPQVTKAADEIVSIVKNPNLSEAEKKSAIWIVLNK